MCQSHREHSWCGRMRISLLTETTITILRSKLWMCHEGRYILANFSRYFSIYFNLLLHFATRRWQQIQNFSTALFTAPHGLKNQTNVNVNFIFLFGQFIETKDFYIMNILNHFSCQDQEYGNSKSIAYVTKNIFLCIDST